MATKIDLDKYLYYGVKVHQEMYYEDRKPQEEAYRVKKILETGFIASRKYLKEILTRSEYDIMKNFSCANWNGINNVSITATPKSKLIYDERDSGFMENDNALAYNHYIKKFPSIVLNPLLLKELHIRPEPYNKHIGEIQIEDKIPSTYFVGIMIPNILSESFLEEIIITSDHLDGALKMVKNDLLELTEEEFVYKYYKDAILFENVLKETNSTLPLYHTETGLSILQSNDMLDVVNKVKKKVI